MVCYAIDGDTIRCPSPTGAWETIRVLGVNTPEIGCSGARAAYLATADLLRRSTLIIERHGRDRYGRTLAIVYLNRVSPETRLAEVLIRANLGQPYGRTDRAVPANQLPPRSACPSIQ